ncbi:MULTISPECIES: LysR family transcriptional regulator [unclassified Caballeronia]|uniref:LysR family transcriptional regulator n=1 Tax=unclassified Caballeronia TaxID=2646786 RepID=UPI00025BAD4C|nr:MULTISPECIES: LysR family transcriptional regulator [unclassified Caballeronia]EKS70359.1 LysR family transcriptional regulator [Burkholderia sp. SJ98]MCE4546367.1 LysR family transcriptional regulator [Caballeronia sp. PC1]MCE4573158.1 LysR family transcriptional regulator [Caballeronia sp. CLC5]
MDQFKEVQLFVEVAESGSISKAAESVDLSISAASRYLISLESRLGVQLVRRTTRNLALTEAGVEFYRRCKSILADLIEAESVVKDSTVRPSGTLRVTASLSFCTQHIAPLLLDFTARYPEISVEVIAANRYYDIIENGIDVAVRTKVLEADSNITIKRLASTRRILAAAPSYIKAHGAPRFPAELGRHRLLNYGLADNPRELSFQRDGQTIVVNVKPLLESNDGQVLRVAAMEGMGILVQPKYIVYDDLLAGRLVPVLDEWDLPRLTMNIAFQTRAHMPVKVRLFIDALVDRFAKNEFERLWTH